MNVTKIRCVKGVPTGLPTYLQFLDRLLAGSDYKTIARRFGVHHETVRRGCVVCANYLGSLGFWKFGVRSVDEILSTPVANRLRERMTEFEARRAA
jgi:hypothetical protein